MTEDNFRNEIDPYDVEELQKYFDPHVLNSLSELIFSEIQWTRLTIAFWDISGFSNLCNKLTDKPVHFVSFLKEYSDEGSRIINGRKGILDKFIGDGIMAYFGYQGKYAASGPNDALLAALEFRDKFQEIKDRYESLWFSDLGKQIDINLKCGMHVGYFF
jgi:class 3 adenylate cyclase